jgi:signal peptidase
MNIESIAEMANWRRGAKLLAVAAFVLVLGAFVVAAVPQLVGANHSFVVQSSSMSPAIDAGSVVFVSETPPTEIAIGDVITFRDSGPDGETRRVTHRVVGVDDRGGQLQFSTKGDANEDPDPGEVSPSQLVGVVQFDLPLLGYLLSIIRSPIGIVGLVVIPAIALAILELRAMLAAAEPTTPGDEREDGNH